MKIRFKIKKLHPAGLAMALVIVAALLFMLNQNIQKIGDIAGVEISEWSPPTKYTSNGSKIEMYFRMKDEAGLQLARDLAQNGFIWLGDWMVNNTIEPYKQVGFYFEDLKSNKMYVHFLAEK